jgi:hypothetical protein
MSEVMMERKKDIGINDLIKKYNSFFIPAFSVKVATKVDTVAEISLSEMKPPIAVFSVSVNRALNEAGSFTLTVDNPAIINNNSKKYPYLEKDSIFQPKRNVIIEMGYGSQLVPVITGTIESIDVSFGNDGISQLTITGFDSLKQLMNDNEISSHTWGKPEKPVKYSEIAKKIAEDYKLTPEIEDTTVKYPLVKQGNKSDFQFIKTVLAEPVGYEVYVRDKTFHYHLPRINNAPAVKGLDWGKTLISFTPKLDTSSQVLNVEVRGWNPDTQKPVIGIAKTGSERNRCNGQSGSEVARDAGSKKRIFVRKVEMKKQEEVQQHAQAILEKESQKLLTGNGECLGLPEIEPGLRIELSGLGPRYSTIYYVTKVNHSISSSGFKTQFDVMQNTLPPGGKI